MLKSASPEVATYLIKNAISPAATIALKSMLLPAIAGGGVGGITGLLRSEDSPVTGGLTGALAGAGLGAAGGLAGGMLGSRGGAFLGKSLKAQEPIGRKGVQAFRKELVDIGGPKGLSDIKALMKLLGLKPFNPKTSMQKLKGGAWGALGGSGLGTLAGGYSGGRIGESIGTE